jgi:sigma-E factor negative regulatory protein RseA
MSDRLRESVSALVDGEADELELRRLLASDDEVVRTAWRDFHVVRDSISGVDMRFAQFDISQRVQAALADEIISAPSLTARWWRPVASFAVAASVATVVAVGARHFNSDIGGEAIAQTPTVSPVIASSTAAGRVYPAPMQPVVGNVPVSATMTSPLQPVSLDPDQLAQQRLQQYLLRHSERAALNNGQGVITFARVPQLDAPKQ